MKYLPTIQMKQNGRNPVGRRWLACCLGLCWRDVGDSVLASGLATVRSSRRVECISTCKRDRGRRAPALPRAAGPHASPPLCVRRGAGTSLWTSCSYRFSRRYRVCHCLCVLLVFVLIVFHPEDVACATWLHVVDMSLSAPVQAVRGTRTSSLDQLDFQERRQLIASSLSLTDFLHVGAKEVAAVAGQYPFAFCLTRPAAFLTIALRNQRVRACHLAFIRTNYTYISVAHCGSGPLPITHSRWLLIVRRWILQTLRSSKRTNLDLICFEIIFYLIS